MPLPLQIFSARRVETSVETANGLGFLFSSIRRSSRISPISLPVSSSYSPWRFLTHAPVRSESGSVAMIRSAPVRRAIASAFLYGLCYSSCVGTELGGWVLYLLDSVVYLSIALGLFNLIPFPPLDGSKILFAFFPDRTYVKLMMLERYGMLILIALVLFMNRVFEVSPIYTAADAVYRFIFPIAQWANSLTL